MDINALKKFAQGARNLLIDQVSARLDMVLADDASARREHPKAIVKLEQVVAKDRQQVIEQAAYIWFNRFTALRFMDVTGLTNPRTVSPAEGASRPEILTEALAGNFPEGVRPEISEYLTGKRPAHDGQAEAYRLLLIHACNEWHDTMPFMFEKAEDYTELLMPDDLLSPDSILARLRDVMSEEACQDVEIIGWLYQFYISEKKDQVFAGLKKNQKITAENIPAATQLFTPHWIVRYLVENSLGRLWLLNRPQSKLAEKMDYYIVPEEPETDFLRIIKPEEIKICDPACGSGHMLTYAFDLLHSIYEEEGYEATVIPGLILQHNLTGIEIDDRAGALAAFALSMKAAVKLGRRRFAKLEAKPDIVVLQNVSFTSAEMQGVETAVGKDVFTDELREMLGEFEQAKNFGSLIVPKLRDPAKVMQRVEAWDFAGDLLLKEMQVRIVAVLRMAEALLPKYHVVVTNPPYMNAGGMNSNLSSWVKGQYPNSKSDLMTCFMERAAALTTTTGFWGMINLPSWMFLTSFEKSRLWLIETQTVSSLLQLGRGIFGSDFGSVAFVMKAISPRKTSFGVYRRLFDKHVDVRKSHEIEALFLDKLSGKYIMQQSEFGKIPGNTIAYWASDNLVEAFENGQPIHEIATPRAGMITGNNAKFMRLFHEVNNGSFSASCSSREEARDSQKKWFPYQKGGPYRKYYGNLEYVVDWENDGYRLKNTKNSNGKVPAHAFNDDFIFRANVNWSALTSGSFSSRLTIKGCLFDASGSAAFPEDSEKIFEISAFLNSPVARIMISCMNPTLNFQAWEIGSLPLLSQRLPRDNDVAHNTKILRDRAKLDWDAFETSWDFTMLPLIHPDHRAETLEDSYIALRSHWQEVTDEMQRLEEENNRIFINTYGLQDELTPEVPLNEITITCNPAYRYGVKGSVVDREARLLEDTVAEFLHYAVGCMFGRYSLDLQGLILANQGEGIEDYLDRAPEPSFMPDRDNVIPVLDDDWFADDIVTRAREFLRVTFGDAKFRENLAFIEKALGKDLRKWFTKDFFEYHVRRYKKRPIYWMFSSPKGSFNALIYMHRYRPDTVSIVLNQYLREFIAKLEIERTRLEKLAADPTATPAEQTKAQKEIALVIKQIAELTEWERDVVYPMAQKKIAIDLDDGVKRNYPLFAGALKPIKGLETSDE